jgi:phenylacetate-CoA ligase
MKLVRGTNVYPRAVEAIVREYKEIDEFRIHLYTADGRQDEIEVLVEIPPRDGVDPGRILTALAKSLSQAHEGLRIGVKQAENGSLPRFELKAKRLQDDRTVIGTAGERRVSA